MRIKPRWLGPLASLFFLCILTASAVEIGMERILVVHELGRPTSSVARGNTEVLTYAKGVRITLTAGRVSEITGLPAVAASAPVAAQPAVPARAKTEADELDKMEKVQADAAAKSRAELEKTIGDLENLHDHPPARAAPKFKLTDFALGLALKWLLTLAALKLTCKYWGAEVFWTGLMTVALVDVLVRGGIGLIGLLLLQMPSLFYADEAVAALVMVLVLRKVSINESLAQAVQITMTTKTFSIVVGSLLFTVLMRLVA